MTPVDRLRLAPGERVVAGAAGAEGGRLLPPSPFSSPILILVHTHVRSSTDSLPLLYLHLRTHTPSLSVLSVFSFPLPAGHSSSPSQPRPPPRESKQQPSPAPATTAIAAAAAAATTRVERQQTVLARHHTRCPLTRGTSQLVPPAPAAHPRLPLLLLPLFEWR